MEKFLRPKVALLSALLLVTVLPRETWSHSPILIVPGWFGSQLEVMDIPTNWPWEDFFCLTPWTKLWVSLQRLTLLPRCALRELELNWNSITDEYSNQEGVRIRAKGLVFGYFKEFMNFFVDNYGYKQGSSIDTVPYDWRLAADELERNGYYYHLKQLIEEMYENNENQKVTIIGHSLGGPVSHYFLTGFHKVNQAWKDKYIHAYIPLAGAWSGINSSLRTITSGFGLLPDTSGFFNGILSQVFLNDKNLAPVIRSLESVYWLMPRASVWGDKVLVATPSNNYTARNYEQMFSDLGLENSFKMFLGVMQINPDFPLPNVATYCYYGIGKDTPKSFYYEKDFSNTPPTGDRPVTTMGDGDDTVNVESSAICLRWAAQHEHYTFEHKEFIGLNHMDIVSDERILSDIAKIVIY